MNTSHFFPQNSTNGPLTLGLFAAVLVLVSVRAGNVSRRVGVTLADDRHVRVTVLHEGYAPVRFVVGVLPRVVAQTRPAFSGLRVRFQRRRGGVLTRGGARLGLRGDVWTSGGGGGGKITSCI